MLMKLRGRGLWIGLGAAVVGWALLFAFSVLAH